MVKVSVIIPVYGTEKWVGECLDSVLSQTLKEIEVICIDDASPDRCPEILDDYATRDSRVKVIHFPQNHLQGYGRNRGTETASGKYIYYLDSDDFIVPGTLKELYEAAEADDLDGIFFDSSVSYENEELGAEFSGYETGRNCVYEDRVYSGAELFEAFVENDDWNVYVQRQFWKKSFLQSSGAFFPEGVIHEDEFFSHAAILAAERVRYINKAYFVRRFREDSATTGKIPKRDFKGYFRSLCEMLRLAELRRDMGLETTMAEKNNILHLYELSLISYSEGSGIESPDGWVADETDLEVFNIFKYISRYDDYYAAKNAPIWRKIDGFDHIYVYGAGKLARAAIRRINLANHKVEKVIVKSKAGNPGSLMGIEVIALQDVDIPESTAIVAALSEKYHREVSEALKNKGAVYFLYAHAKLSGPFGLERVK